MATVEQGTLLQPTSDGFEVIPDGLVVLDNKGIVEAFGSREAVLAQIPGLALSRQQAHGRVIMPGTADTHTHTFQPPGIPGVLIEDRAQKGEKSDFQGWLPATLRRESEVKKDPEGARTLIKERFARYIEHGITASLEYTTSSIEALRIVLQEAKNAGLGGRIKAGYVAMDQQVDFIDGVHLEVRDSKKQDAILRQIRELAQDFPGQIVIIDRFPIAVSSPYRKKLAALAQELGVLYETHVDESEGELAIHKNLYEGRNIMRVLSDDGVFADGMKVGLAHAIHTTGEGSGIVQAATNRGVEVYIRFCPDSNGQLRSHMRGGFYEPIHFAAWEMFVGANRITLGTDKGAGTGWSMFAEALKERARPHAAGVHPTEAKLLRMATANGLESLGLDDRLKVGGRANFIVVDAATAFYPQLPTDLESLAALTLRAGQTPSNVRRVVVNGSTLKNS